MGLQSIRHRAKAIYEKEVKAKNKVNQQFQTTRPNEVWVSDVTYFRTPYNSYYICVILDLYSRKVIAHRIALNNSTQLVKNTFKDAYETRQPKGTLIFHSDRGGNYRSKTFCNYLKYLKVTQSFSRAYTPYDNSVVESFFSSLKREELYRTKYRSDKEFKKAVESIWSSTTANVLIRTIIIGHQMPKKPNITAKIAPDVLLQEFKSEEFYFFDLKISLFWKYVSHPKSNSITLKPFQIKG